MAYLADSNHWMVHMEPRDVVDRFRDFVDILCDTVAAWARDRTGYIIDYGTYPERRKHYFFKSSTGNETLRQAYRGSDVTGATRQGDNGTGRRPFGRTVRQRGRGRLPDQSAPDRYRL